MRNFLASLIKLKSPLSIFGTVAFWCGGIFFLLPTLWNGQWLPLRYFTMYIGICLSIGLIWKIKDDVKNPKQSDHRMNMVLAIFLAAVFFVREVHVIELEDRIDDLVRSAELHCARAQSSDCSMFLDDVATIAYPEPVYDDY